jgi:PAS domain S-box-containing protein
VPRDDDLRWGKWLRRIVVFTVLLVCLGPALMFNIRQVMELRAELGRDAFIQSRLVARFALESPTDWTSRPEALRGVLNDVIDKQMHTLVTVLGRPMLDTGAVIHRPEVSVSHDIVVHGEVFGQVVVSKSLRTRLPAMATFLGTGVTIALLALLGLQRRVFRRLDEAEASRRLVQQRLADIAELASDWFWEQDAEGRHTIHTLEGRMGWQRTPLVGRCLWDLPTQLLPVQWDRHRLDLAAHKPFVLRYAVETEVGPRWHEITGKPMLDLNGRFLGYRGAGRDITRDQMREQELARHRDELQSRLDASQ